MNSSASAAASANSIVATTTSGAATIAVNSTDINGVNGQFHKGEPDQSRPQTLPQPEAQPSSQPQFQTQTEIPNPVASVSTTVTTTSEFVNAPPLNPSPSGKLPFRPSKIRKLSPDNPPLEAERGGASNTAAAAATAAIIPVNECMKSNLASASKAAKNRTVVAQSRAQSTPRVVLRPLSYQGEIERALQHLRSADPHLAQLIDLHQLPTFDSFQTPFLALTKSILYQQLAYKAGTSIYARFVALCGGEEGVLPETVLALTPQQLRQIGVSGRKAGYLHDLARKYQNGILSDASIISMDDKSLFTMLTMVNGIGCWSVHMFMIFSLHRPDVLPVNDLGVRKGVQLLYGLEDLPRPSQMDQLCEKWRPYRSVASWYLWRFVEAKGTPSSAAAVAVAGMGLQQQQQEQQLQQLRQQLSPPCQQQLPQQQQQQQPPQFIDPINEIMSLGACAWGQ